MNAHQKNIVKSIEQIKHAEMAPLYPYNGSDESQQDPLIVSYESDLSCDQSITIENKL